MHKNNCAEAKFWIGMHLARPVILSWWCWDGMGTVEENCWTWKKTGFKEQVFLGPQGSPLECSRFPITILLYTCELVDTLPTIFTSQTSYWKYRPNPFYGTRLSRTLQISCMFYQLKICGNPVLSILSGAIFLTASIHSVLHCGNPHNTANFSIIFYGDLCE